MRQKTVHTLQTLRAQCVEDGGCLTWRGYHGNKVPMVYHDGQLVAVRRLFTRLLTGHAHDHGYYGLTCENKSCVEPLHTVWRSKKQHSSHMAKAANQSSSVQAIRRAKISAARLTLSAEIMHDILSSNESGPILAARHGISRSTVNNYRRGKRAATRAHNIWAGLGAR